MKVIIDLDTNRPSRYLSMALVSWEDDPRGTVVIERAPGRSRTHAYIGEIRGSPDELRRLAEALHQAAERGYDLYARRRRDEA